MRVISRFEIRDRGGGVCTKITKKMYFQLSVYLKNLGSVVCVLKNLIYLLRVTGYRDGHRHCGSDYVNGGVPSSRFCADPRIADAYISGWWQVRYDRV